MSDRRGIALTAVITVVIAVIIGCGTRETPGIARRISGTLLVTQPVGGILGVPLPTGREFPVRTPNDNRCPVYSISGPDSTARVAYLETCASSYRLKLGTLDGSADQEIFAREGTLEQGVMALGAGRCLALSRMGGRLAFLSQLRGRQLDEPAAFLYVGRLELWSVEEKAGGDSEITGLDAGLSWFPDGRRLAYVELVPRDQIRPSVGGTYADGSLAKWAAVPVVYILDTETRVRTFLHPGWKPVVSSDGKTVLVSDFNGRWRLVDVRSGSSIPARWPAAWGDAIALLDSEIVLYWGAPRSGIWARYTFLGSMGPKRLVSMKVAELNSVAYETVIPYIDPRKEVSFGRIASQLGRR